MRKLIDMWYQKDPRLKYLYPLSLIMRMLGTCWRGLHKIGLEKITKLPVPVVVVGNIAVGGTGKTPLVAELCRLLREWGYHPGIISRGYGGVSTRYPVLVTGSSKHSQVGDEALMLYQRTHCPVAVAPNRPQAGQALIDQAKCDILISDDGLQHYALARDIEIALLHGKKRLGNGWLLPAGPLRELPKRLQSVDFVVNHGGPLQAGEYLMQTRLADTVFALHGRDKTKPLHALRGHTVHAVAGIAHPQHFFDGLKAEGLSIAEHAFADHHRFSAKDFAAFKNATVLMTEKDAVKCTDLDLSDAWVVPQEVILAEDFIQAFKAKIQTLLTI